MINRYPGTAGVRLDSDNNSGPAVDLGRASSKKVSLWVRDERAVARVTLDVADLQALRDGANRLLVSLGAERVVEVNV